MRRTPLLLPLSVFCKIKDIMAKVYEFLATGFEDIEALATVDILRRGGLDVKTVSITGSEYVETAHGVTVKADMLFEEACFGDADLLVLPGGMPGAANLNSHEGVRRVLTEHNERGRRIAAICAAPMVLGGLGMLLGKRATCYPGFEKFLIGADCTQELFVTDGNITTGEGPAATFPFAYELLALLTTADKAREVAEGMMFVHLMENRREA